MISPGSSRIFSPFDEAIKVTYDFQKNHPDTLLVITADHETGE